ncbi:MAG: SDR family oxidoreductase [Oscillospiraceae bacterium]|nr:SDR family oxidoreductase [Oscillospiraceae bacterium]
MIALVTGASAGIGRDIARSLAKHGINLIITARRKDRLLELKKELTEAYGVKVKTITADLSSEKQVRELYRRVRQYDIDILINNAGLGVFGGFTETDLDKELEMLDINIRAFHILFKLFLRDFENRDCGYILNTASSAGFFPGPLFSSYYATKAYVVRMTEAVYEELRCKNSGVNLSMLCPGPVATEFLDRAGVTFAMKPQSSEYVAEYAVREMFGGRLMICPSPLVTAGIYLRGLLPEPVLAYGARLIQSRREEK